MMASTAKYLMNNLLDSTRKAPSTECLYRFGLIADVQHADIPDGYNFSKTKKRYYRNSLTLLQQAVNVWKQGKCDCAFQLGDLIDGFSRQGPKWLPGGASSLLNSKLLSATSKGCSGVSGRAFYTIVPFPQFRIIVLDCYEISLLGTEEDSPEHSKAWAYLSNNPNEDKNNPDGLDDYDMRFVKFNGAVSSTQLNWLESILSESVKNKENVIIMGHNPMYKPSTSPVCLCWNYDEVMDVFNRYGNCVLCYIAGHDHDSGSATDPAGILHITMPGIIEIPPGKNGYAIGKLYQNSLYIEGTGRMHSYKMDLKYIIEDKTIVLTIIGIII
ncbi:hypothetical protein KUTeg_004167 [Tegillarca granosa]|uniref:Calcineurin-like phosphoesterase domain-containing protein n=1 Tax=Tegillarca granosa TaxID=220873 RepID=A0ABQ9FSC3_TEGGR|nr:hypothetical protein KUTeg_004167 [Tegillarca granosa]